MLREDLQDRAYLVYVGHDGYHIVLWVESPGAFGLGAVALEPPVLKRLEEYRERLRAS